MTRRPLALLALTCVLTLGGATSAAAYTGTSLDDNVSPASQTHGLGLADQWPSNRFGLDHHVGDIVNHAGGHIPGSGGLIGPKDKPGFFDWLLHKTPTGVNYDALQASSRHTLAETIWDASRWVWNIIITLLTFALSIDLLAGPNGLLGPVAGSARRLYNEMGHGWTTVAVVALGAYVLIFACLRRQITQTFGKVALTFAMVAFALLLLSQSQWTIGGTSRYVNQASLAVIGTVTGDDSADAKVAASNVLFDTGVVQPFLVLNFGGLEHCVDAHGDPVGPNTAACTNGGTKINNRKYLKRWLAAGPPNSSGRQLEYEAVRDAKTPDASAISDAGLPADAFDGYKLTAADTPAVDIQQQEIAGDRLIIAILIVIGTLGAALLVGGLAAGIIVSTLRALFLFAGTAVAAILAMFPGSGHRGFWWWLERLALALGYAFVYSLVLAFVLVITRGLTATGPQYGWKLTYLIIALFWWSMFFLRKRAGRIIMRHLPGATGTHDRDRSASDYAQGWYYKSRAAKAIVGATGVGAGISALGHGGRATAGAVRDGGRGLKDRAGEYAGRYAGAQGHTERFHETADLHGRALDELERDHAHNARRHRTETQNRARYDELAGRHRAAQDNPIPDDVRASMDLPRLSLSAAERREMDTLERGRMPQEEYVGLRDTVGDVERHRRDTGGQPFSAEQITERAEQIRRREQEQDDLAHRAKHYAEHEHEQLFGAAETAGGRKPAKPRTRTHRRFPDARFSRQQDRRVEEILERRRRRTRDQGDE